MNICRVGILSAIIFLGLAMNSALAVAETETAAKNIQNPLPAVSAAESARVERMEKLQALTKQLFEEQGYKLAKGEPFKYLAEPQSEVRNLLYHVSMNEDWSSRPIDNAFEPFMIVFQTNDQGDVVWTTSSKGVTTLGKVLEYVLELMPYEYECAPGLLTTYMPGDWVLSPKPDRPREMTDAELTVLQSILNDQLNLGVRVAWKDVERPALVIRGTYTAAPKQIIPNNGQFDPRSDGMFVINARRAVSYHPPLMDGDYEAFKSNLSYLLKLPILDEAETQPVNKRVTWNETGKPVEGDERLAPEHENRVLKSLHEQMGYEFHIEPRKVRLLSIQPVEP